MRKIVLIFILMLFIPITKVNGFYCTYTEIAQLKKIASNVTYFYEYNDIDGQITFDITLVNLNKDIYFVDSTNNKKYEFTETEIKLTGYKSGETVIYTFYPVNSYCQDETLYTLRIILPTYNPFYKDKICSGIENYSLCQKWSSHNLTYEQFVKKVEQYKNSIKEETNEDMTEDNNDNLNYIIEFFINYYYIFIIIFIIMFVGLYVARKKDNIYN